MKVVVSFIAAVIFLLAYLLSSCNNIRRNNSHRTVPISNIEKGKVLAANYCQSCHLLPDPLLVDSKTWEKGILPNMGPRLGIFRFNKKNYPSSKYDPGLSSNFYPSKPVLTDEEWGYIIDYYTSASPDSISARQSRPYPIKKTLSQFIPLTPQFNYPEPATSCVKIDASDTLHPLNTSDAIKQMIYRFNKNIVLTDSIKTNGPVVNIEIQNHEWLATNIGILIPDNGKYGEANYFKKLHNGQMQIDSNPLFNRLQRPVQIITADLNNDNKQDYIICEFGYLEGALVWMENTGDGKFARHILRQFPGAIKAYVQDYNHDGLLDIWALFAQGEEGVFLFTNLGHGQFSQEEVLRFPSINGSSYFELADFNKDGYPDIVYTCGDNADFSTVLKPFHGVYIYLNDGKNHFEKKYFFPINGCYKAIARDFDHDGDLDIATIAYFADYEHQPEEGFIYLENKGNYNFLPYSLPAAETGRWLTMDAGDFDGDGKTDLILGNFSKAPSFIKSKNDWKKGPPFIILKNTGRNN